MPDQKVIMIIDDDEWVRDYMRIVFETENFSVLTASTGTEAIAKADLPVIDVLITDLLMPGIDVGSIIGSFKQRHPEIKTFVMSGVVDGEKDSEVMAEFDVTGTLPKPIDRERLLDIVHQSIGVYP